MQLREGVHPVLTDDGGAILDERTGRWTHLTPTATAAVMLLLSGASPSQAAEHYADRYRLTPEKALSDIQAVTRALAAAGLTHPPARARRRRWWWR